MYNRDSKSPKGSEMETLKRYSSDSYSQEPRKKAKSFDMGHNSCNISDSTEENRKRFIFKKTTSAPTTTESLMPNKIINHNTHQGPSSSVMRTGQDITLNEKPEQIRIGKHNKSTCRRKFPGPAGLLPTQRSSSNSEIEDPDLLSKVEDISSQVSGSWEKMLADYQAACGRINLPEKYNIQWIKNRVLANELINQRTPFLAAFIHSISNAGPNEMVNVVLKDKSGTIQGTISPKLHEEYSNDLTVGSVLVLKQIGVLNAGLSTEPYLIISPNNLISIYTNQSVNSNPANEISRIIVRNTSIDDIYKYIDEISCDNRWKKPTVKPLLYSNCSKSDTNRCNTNKNNFDNTKTMSFDTSCDKDDEIDELMVQFLEQTESSNTNVRQEDSNVSKENMNDRSTAPEKDTSGWKLLSNNSPDKAKDNHRIVQDMFEGLDTNLLFEDF